jgi:probable rRNA maturation factor
VSQRDWREKLPDPAAFCRKTVRTALSAVPDRLPSAHALSVCVLLADDARIRHLNAQHRSKDAPTDVLSFPSASGWPENSPERPLGDIVLAWESVQRGARARAVPFADHVAHLLVHAALHLVGFDHDREATAHVMESCETRILNRMGIADPYAARTEGDLKTAASAS